MFVIKKKINKPEMVVMYKSRPIEGLFQILTLVTLCNHYMEQECLAFSALCQISWIAALVVGSQKEGIRIPQLVIGIPFVLHFFVEVVTTGIYSYPNNPWGILNFLSWMLASAAWIHSV